MASLTYHSGRMLDLIFTTGGKKENDRWSQVMKSSIVICLQESLNPTGGKEMMMTMHNRMHLGGGGKRVCYGNIILSQLILSSPVHPNLAIPQPQHHHNRHRRHHHHHHHHITKPTSSFWAPEMPFLVPQKHFNDLQAF